MTGTFIAHGASRSVRLVVKIEQLTPASAIVSTEVDIDRNVGE